jgi:hypothetical protein
MKNKLQKKVLDHWHENLMILQLNFLSRQKLTRDIHTDILSCPFCLEYYSKSCKECPIYLKSGEICCRETPYVRVLKALRISQAEKPKLSSYQQLFNAIAEEINFLETLCSTK